MHLSTEMSVLVIVSFVVGFLLGYLSAIVLTKTVKFTSNTFVLIVVILVWALTRIVDLIDPNFTTPLALDTLAGIIVGFFYKPIKDKYEKKNI